MLFFLLKGYKERIFNIFYGSPQYSDTKNKQTKITKKKANKQTKKQKQKTNKPTNRNAKRRKSMKTVSKDRKG